jgi:hypothetical protein
MPETANEVKTNDKKTDVACDLLYEIVTRARNSMEYRSLLPAFRHALREAPSIQRVIVQSIGLPDVSYYHGER